MPTRPSPTPDALLRVARSLDGRIPDLGQDAVARLLRDIATGRLVVIEPHRSAA